MSKQTETHKLADWLNPTTPPLSIKVRKPGWRPDAIDVSGKRTNLFLEEAIGGEKISGTSSLKAIAFPVQFAEVKNNCAWVLGTALHSPVKGQPFTILLNDLATLVRRYNAALYTLRRIKFYFDLYKGPHDYPPSNPHGRDKELAGLSKAEIAALIPPSENDWDSKTTELNDFLDARTDGFKDPERYLGFVFHAADMIEVNNYIVSMRVIVFDKPGTGELVGSSSHVSISSPFSSSSP